MHSLCSRIKYTATSTGFTFVTVTYTNIEGVHLKEKRLKEEPMTGELFLCDDNLWRTKEEKETWDKSMGFTQEGE